MSSGAKRFLVGYFGVYLVVALMLNFFLGPPGLSENYLDKYKQDHDRYMAITKEDAYKRWRMRPELHPFYDYFGFAEAYESRPEFVAEQRRRALYDNLFDIFNVAMVVVLFWRFGRRPLAKFVHAQVNEVRHRIDRVEKHRTQAEKARLEVERKFEHIPEERAQANRETEQRIARERERIDDITQKGLALLEQELQDRKQYEETLAEKAVKEELVNEAMDLIMASYEGSRTSESENALLSRFLTELEAHK